MKILPYKGNRLSPQELDLRFAKGQLRVVIELLERYHRVNTKQVAKGLPPKHDQEKIRTMEADIETRRQSIEKMVANRQ